MFDVPARHADASWVWASKGSFCRRCRCRRHHCCQLTCRTKLRGSVFNHAPHDGGHPSTSPWLKTVSHAFPLTLLRPPAQNPYTWFSFGEVVLEGGCYALTLAFLAKAVALLPSGLHRQEKVSLREKGGEWAVLFHVLTPFFWCLVWPTRGARGVLRTGMRDRSFAGRFLATTNSGDLFRNGQYAPFGSVHTFFPRVIRSVK